MISKFERQQVEAELKNFTSRNLEKPADCKNPDQIRFYVKELCRKIDEYEMRFNYVPQWAYSMLAQYNLVQNKMIQIQFSKTYS